MVYKNCKLVAEIGCVHAGSALRAIRLVNLAAGSGADCVKFQKRNPHLSTPEHLKNEAHPNPHFAYGETYLQHRINLELTIEDHIAIKNACDTMRVKYGCSVWDIDSARDIIGLKPYLLKIPSACNLNYNLIEYCLDNHEGDLHVSLGMTSLIQRESLYRKYISEKDRIIFYHCVSEYPCPFERMQLLGISEIIEAGFRAGFSNHGYGIACDIAAMVLGAEYDERHFIDDRTFRHTDAAASLEPEGLRKLRRDFDAVHMALKNKEDMTEEERLQANKLKSSNA